MESDTVESTQDPRPRLAALRALALVGGIVGLVAGLHAYIGWRILSGLGAAGWASVAGWTVVGALFLLLPSGLFVRGLRSQRFAFALRWLSYVWMGVFGVLLSAVVFVDLVSAAYALLGSAPAGPRWSPLQVAVVAGLVAPAVAWGLRVASGPARIERVRVAMKGLGPALDGLRIVQISDVHIGETLDRDFARRVVEQVNALKPDVIAITGDLVDGTVRRLRDEVAPFAGLRARHGVFFVTGNHEYYSGPVAWMAELRRLGITVLHNEHRVIERGGDRVVIGGVSDYNGGDFDPSHASSPRRAFAGAPQGVPRVLLAHQPRTAFAAAECGVDLQLSGHTHGGQIFPWMFFVRLQQPVLKGLRTVAGVRVYTHRGTGFWGPPLRVGADPEIAEITLARA